MYSDVASNGSSPVTTLTFKNKTVSLDSAVNQSPKSPKSLIVIIKPRLRIIFGNPNVRF